MTNMHNALLIDLRRMTNWMSCPARRSVLAGALVLQFAGSTAFGAVGLGRAFPLAKGSPDNPAVVPLQSNAFGTTYEDLAAKFWQWQFSMPVTANPAFDTADCSTNQSGKVWFLATSSLPFETSPGVLMAVAYRNCKVPNGTALFFPVMDAECSTIPGDQLPPFQPEPAQLKGCARYAATLIDLSKLVVIVDGVPIRALGQYQVSSPNFPIGPLPANNMLESFGLPAPAGTKGEAAVDGIHLLLHPLPPGLHTLYIRAEVDQTPLDAPRIIFDTTYRLTVTK